MAAAPLPRCCVISDGSGTNEVRCEAPDQNTATSAATQVYGNLTGQQPPDGSLFNFQITAINVTVPNFVSAHRAQ